MATTKVKDYHFKILTDVGAIINVIDKETYGKMQKSQLRATKLRGLPYRGDSPAKLLRFFRH